MQGVFAPVLPSTGPSSAGVSSAVATPSAAAARLNGPRVPGKRLLESHPDYYQQGPVQHQARPPPRRPGGSSEPQDPPASAPPPAAAASSKRTRGSCQARESPVVVSTPSADRVQSLVLGFLDRVTHGVAHGVAHPSIPGILGWGLSLSLARQMDMDYCRHVQGASHARTLSAVWGPRDGAGLNTIDARRLQDDLYEYITQRVDAILERRDEEEQAAQRAKEEGDQATPEQRGQEEGSQLIKNLAREAKMAREEFNEGWNEIYQVGVVNEVVAAEVQALLMLRRSGAIRSWDQALPGNDIMTRVRLLRRLDSTRVPFASCVGSIMISSMQTRPSVRPTKYVLQRAALDTGLQFQALIMSLHGVRSEIVGVCNRIGRFLRSSGEEMQRFIMDAREGGQDPEDIMIPLYSLIVDYHNPNSHTRGV